MRDAEPIRAFERDRQMLAEHPAAVRWPWSTASPGVYLRTETVGDLLHAERERVLAEFETLADNLAAAARGGFSTSAPHIRALAARLRGPS